MSDNEEECKAEKVGDIGGWVWRNSEMQGEELLIVFFSLCAVGNGY